MTSNRTKSFVLLILLLGAAALWFSLVEGSPHWIRFAAYLLAVLLTSGMKVRMLKSDGTMSVNFPLILLGMVDLSPPEVVGLGVCSVLAQCNWDVVQRFTLTQTAFNIANVTISIVLATLAFGSLAQTYLGLAPAITCAAGLYFVLNTIPVAIVIGFESSASPWRIWRTDFFWYFPFYLVGATIAAAAALLKRNFGWPTAMLLLPLVYAIYRTYNEQIANLRAKQLHMEETEALHLRTIEGLAMAVEAKDQGTHRHLQRVRVYVSELGRIMNLDPDLMKALLTAAFLHDIGKLAVPERIINKPGKLTKEEFKLMKIHPGVGADLLERVRFPYPVVPIVRSHHESWDGSGYPDGLKGEEIPLGARILSVVDCFDALASDRPYRKAMSPADALAVVKSKAGIQFDAAIVELLEAHLPYLEEQAALQMDAVKPLNTDITVDRGAAPGAGVLVESAAPDHSKNPERNDSWLDGGGAANEITLAGLEAEALLYLSRKPGFVLAPGEVCALLARRLSALVQFDCLAVFLRKEKALLPIYKQGKGADSFNGKSINVGEGISGWVAETELPSINGNPTVEPTYAAAGSAFITEKSSAISIPLFERTGSLFGVLSLYSSQETAFSSHHLQLLLAMQSNFASALEAAQGGIVLDVEPAEPAVGGDNSRGAAIKSAELEPRHMHAQVDATVIRREPALACSVS